MAANTKIHDWQSFAEGRTFDARRSKQLDQHIPHSSSKNFLTGHFAASLHCCVDSKNDPFANAKLKAILSLNEKLDAAIVQKKPLHSLYDLNPREKFLLDQACDQHRQQLKPYAHKMKLDESLVALYFKLGLLEEILKKPAPNQTPTPQAG